MAHSAYDLVVVGAGMTGAGVALDAASRGLRVAMIDSGDVASGTSSKSSKMVHGGLRYLQQREFRLVYENLRERQRLLENAPFLVRPLPFLVPLFGRNGVASKAVEKGYSTALRLYALTGGWRIGRRHRKISRDETLAHLPTLNADERMVKQVLLNLLSNAIKFTPRGSVRVTAGVDPDDSVSISVIDTGIGIAPENIEKALMPFVQIDSSLQRKYAGTGLGLPLARSMIEHHGGDFEIESKVGEGTAITVRFPPVRSLRIPAEPALRAAG